MHMTLENSYLPLRSVCRKLHPHTIASSTADATMRCQSRWNLLTLSLAFVCLVFATKLNATTYYIDSVAGSDGNTGTSPSAPWQTFTNVNNTTFAPGDFILLLAGDSWNGNLYPKGSGIAGSPITISSYGTGAMPVINGASTGTAESARAAVFLYNQSYWTIQGLEVMNTATTPLYNGLGRWGIGVDNEFGGTVKGITIQGNYVHDVYSCFVCSDTNAQMTGGIVVVADSNDILYLIGSDSYNGVLIANNVVGNLTSTLGRTGITFWDNSAGGVWGTVSAASLSQGVVVEGNTVTDTDSDGIIVVGTIDALMQHNVVANAGQKTVTSTSSTPDTEPGTVGLWPARSIGTVVQYNEVYGTLTQGNTDGEGYDIDIGCTNVTVQYNYSHDNQGGFIVMEGGTVANSSNDTVRYNLSINDSYGGVKGVFDFGDGAIAPNTQIYNNTVYIASGLTSQPINCEGCAAGTTGNWTFENNIVVNYGSGGYNAPGLSGAGVISNNIFYGNHNAGEPADPNEITSDPQFIAPTSAAPKGFNSVTGWQVSPTSPAVGSGMLIPNNGGLDYFSDPVSATAAPTRGFYEAQQF